MTPDLLTPIRQQHGCPDCRGHLNDSAGPEAAISDVGLSVEGRGMDTLSSPPAHPEPRPAGLMRGTLDPHRYDGRRQAAPDESAPLWYLAAYFAASVAALTVVFFAFGWMLATAAGYP